MELKSVKAFIEDAKVGKNGLEIKLKSVRLNGASMDELSALVQSEVLLDIKSLQMSFGDSDVDMGDTNEVAEEVEEEQVELELEEAEEVDGIEVENARDARLQEEVDSESLESILAAEGLEEVSQ